MQKENQIPEIDSSSNNIQSRISEIKKIISQKTDIALNNSLSKGNLEKSKLIPT
jgi:hypothetical protein